jgi:hypothetical protein
MESATDILRDCESAGLRFEVNYEKGAVLCHGDAPAEIIARLNARAVDVSVLVWGRELLADWVPPEGAWVN